MTPRLKWAMKNVVGFGLGIAIGLILYKQYFASDGHREPEWFGQPVVEGVVKSYSGKYRDNPKVKSLLSNAPGLRKRTLSRLEERTGLRIAEPEKILLAFRDASPGFGYKAVSRVVRSPMGLLQLSEIGLERFVAGTLDLETTLVHEFTHSVMRQSMKERYHEMPRWFREGAAVWAAKQLDSKVRLELARCLHRGKGSFSVLDGLIGDHDIGANYLDEGFVFAALEDRCGVACVRRVLSDVVNGMSYDAAVEKALDVPLETLLEFSRQQAEEYIETLLVNSGADELTAAIEKRKAGNKEGAILDLRSLLARYPNSFLSPVAQFELAGMVFEVSSPEESLEAYSAVIARGLDYPWLATDAVYIRARRLLIAGHYGRAVVAFQDFIRDYAWNGAERMADADFNLAAAYIGTDHPERAVELIPPTLKIMHSAQARLARTMLRDAYKMLGREAAAKDLQALLDADPPVKKNNLPYLSLGTYSEFGTLARRCSSDSDCIIVTLPQCRDSCSPDPCGSIGWENKAVVNKDVRSRYLAMLEDQELAKCAEVDCGACEENDRPGVNRPDGQTPPSSHQAVCVDGTCSLNRSN